MTSATSRRQGAPWMRAAGLALVVHLAVALVVAWVRPFEAAPVARPAPAPLDIVFAPPPARPEPSAYTQLPEAHETEPPDDAELLANVASRAQDVATGEGTAPAGDHLDIPQVDLRSAPEAPRSEEAPDETPVPEPRPDPSSDPTRTDDTLDARGRAATPEASAPAAMAPPTSRFDQSLRAGGSGLSRIGNDVRLSTTAWAYAPWLEAFRERFEPNWIAPSGYGIGIIHGWTDLLIQVEPDGSVSRMEVLAEEGHPALHVASVDALKYSVPLPPLPADFPDDNLIFQLRLAYPERPRPAPRREAPVSRRR